MNAIEQAHLRYERNKAQRERQAAKALVPEPAPEPVIEIPKERPMADARITVTVELPNGCFTFELKKKDVLDNVPNQRLNAKEFRRCFVDGLKPLLGDVS